jgi:hypothetical protein
MPYVPKGETPTERLVRLEQTFGLNKAQLATVLGWSNETLAFVVSVAAAGGVGCRHVGRALASLESQGFLSIKANGKEAVARLTLDGYRARVLRLNRVPYRCARSG